MRCLPVLILLWAAPAFAEPGSLLGSELRLRTIAQATPGAPLVISSFPARAIVDAARIEFPGVASLSDPDAPLPPTFGDLVNVSIDVGADYIEIGFSDVGAPSYFAPAHQNTYVFSFEAEQAIFFRGAEIDRRFTNVPLADTDVWFQGNELFVNVENLPFDDRSLIRIYLRPDLMMM